MICIAGLLLLCGVSWWWGGYCGRRNLSGWTLAYGLVPILAAWTVLVSRMFK